MTVLGDAEIHHRYLNGQLVIHPFRREQLNNASYDIRLGRFMAIPVHHGAMVDPTKADAEDHFKIVDIDKFENSRYMLKPGFRVLGHTHEFIGGRLDSARVSGGHKNIQMKISSRLGYLGSMQTKSTLARWGIDICMAAGWGDCDFTTRWALEIINVSPWILPLYPGTLIGQVVFEEVRGVETSYTQSGSYQKTLDMDTIVKTWKPEDILPKKVKIVPLEKVDSFPLA